MTRSVRRDFEMAYRRSQESLERQAAEEKAGRCRFASHPLHVCTDAAGQVIEAGSGKDCAAGARAHLLERVDEVKSKQPPEAPPLGGIDKAAGEGRRDDG